MQKSIVKFIALSYRHCSTCFRHLLANRPRLRTLPSPHSYGNQRLQRQFDGLLMMGMVMPETCWAVSVRQSNKFYDWFLHLVWCFIWVNWICKSWLSHSVTININSLNPELNPICYLLALLGAHSFLHVNRIRFKSLTFRRLMSFIYGAPILDVSRSHTTTQHSR